MIPEEIKLKMEVQHQKNVIQARKCADSFIRSEAICAGCQYSKECGINERDWPAFLEFIKACL